MQAGRSLNPPRLNLGVTPDPFDAFDAFDALLFARGTLIFPGTRSSDSSRFLDPFQIARQ